MSEATPNKGPLPRHPSAGNLDSRPTLLESPNAPIGRKVDPLAFAVSAVSAAPRLAPGLNAELSAKLFGHFKDRKILELGCGIGSNSVALAKGGARVISVDTDSRKLAAARKLAESEGVKVEFHHGDLADLAFVRADEIDFALCVYSLGEVSDPPRLFRQVHRVMRPESSIVISVAHPVALASGMADGDPTLNRALFDRSTIGWEHNGFSGEVHSHAVGDLVTNLSRANFRVDLVLEPQITDEDGSGYHMPTATHVPQSVIIRARKEGA